MHDALYDACLVILFTKIRIPLCERRQLMYLATFRPNNLNSAIVTYAINQGARILYRSDETFAAMVNEDQHMAISRMIEEME